MTKTNITKSSYHEQVITQIGNPNISDERKQIAQMVLYALEGLFQHGINIYPNIIELFNKNGFKQSFLYTDAITYITKNIAKVTKDNVKWIKQRTFKKSNHRDKNIIMCYLLFIHQGHFINNLEDFLLQNKSDKENTTNLIEKLREYINKYNNKLPTNSKEDEKNQEITNQELESEEITYQKLDIQEPENHKNKLHDIGHNIKCEDFVFGKDLNFENSFDSDNDWYFYQ